jgi:hypothetical protein
MTTVMTQLADATLTALGDTYHTPLYVFEEADHSTQVPGVEGCRDLPAHRHPLCL